MKFKSQLITILLVMLTGWLFFPYTKPSYIEFVTLCLIVSCWVKLYDLKK